MNIDVKDDQWVFVIVQDPETNPEYLGQHDEKENVSFIPVFLEKEDGLKCFNFLHKDASKKNEVQAVMFDELKTNAAQHGFVLYVLNGEGRIIDRKLP